MSDFLSNFDNNNYKKTRENKEKEKKDFQANTLQKKNEAENETDQEPKDVSSNDESHQINDSNKESNKAFANNGDEESLNNADTEEQPSANVSLNPNEVVEIDPLYKKKQQTKYLIIAIGSFCTLLLLFFGYYQMTHVKVPDFEGKELTEVRQWTSENNVKLQVEQKYDFEAEANKVIGQSIKNRKIKKGKTLVVDASLGANPEEKIKLPDFSSMKLADAQKWIKKNKADNIAVIEEYDDLISKGDYIKFEITNKDVSIEDYKRKDKAKVYYSKGKEVFKQDISVPDFTNKSKEEAKEWAKKNEIDLKLKETDSETIEADKVISQSVAKDTKIAKKETMTLIVSTGKAVVVPDFSQYNSEEAENKSSNLQVLVKLVYNEAVPYGGFISQSVEAGTKYKEKDEKPVIQVVYSSGKPYLKDLRGDTLEGELQKIFYDEYRSKGASITYQVYYVDSAETKGTVVEMSRYNEFVPINCVVSIGISKGNLTSEKSEAIGKNEADELE